MSALLFIFWFLVGFTVIMFINAQIILPFIYNLPIAIYVFARKRLLFRGVLFQLGAPLIWLTLAAALGWFFPNVATWVYNNEALNVGSMVGTIGMLWRALVTSKGRAEMWADFANQLMTATEPSSNSDQRNIRTVPFV